MTRKTIPKSEYPTVGAFDLAGKILGRLTQLAISKSKFIDALPIVSPRERGKFVPNVTDFVIGKWGDGQILTCMDNDRIISQIDLEGEGSIKYGSDTTEILAFGPIRKYQNIAHCSEKDYLYPLVQQGYRFYYRTDISRIQGQFFHDLQTQVYASDRIR